MSTTADTPKPSDKIADAPQPAKKRIALRKLLPWLIVAVVMAFAVYRLKFSPTPVMAHIVATGEVRGEVMGTGTLEARIKTTISPRIQERLAEVLVLPVTPFFNLVSGRRVKLGRVVRGFIRTSTASICVMPSV